LHCVTYMCGIVGYIGKKESLPVLIDGLKRLEYRGYDSAGVAIQAPASFCFKSVGKITELEEKLKVEDLKGNLGIAHTRWATHGEPTEENAHPHSDCSGKIWIVHNGIIENYQKIKEELISEGHKFLSETDSEVFAHLVEKFYQGDLSKAVRRALGEIVGAYSLVVFHEQEPGRLIAAKKGSPLVLGVSEEGMIVASDVTAIIRQTRNVIYLEDGEMVFLDNNNFKIFNFNNEKKVKETQRIDWSLEELEKKGYSHFMLKEIFEQPESLRDSLRGRLISEEGRAKLGGLDNVSKDFSRIKNFFISSCGTAYYASLVGEYMLEDYADLPAKALVASEFRYRKQLLNSDSAVLALSQSGETADTLAAIQEANEKNILTLGIVNVVGSSIARATGAGIYNHIGPEIAVASTKAFTSQITVLALLTLFLGRMRNMSLATGERIVKELNALPEKVEKILKAEEKIEKIAQKYYQASNFAFLGRKYNYPVALEGALKLKEISYIHAEGFAGGEIKHGPLALIDKEFPSLFIVPQDSVYEKNLSNIQEIKARGGSVIAVATQGDEQISGIADEVIYIPKTLEMLTPILSVIPLQLFAYHMACLNGRDVDKPRNLAKSVTVE